MSEFVFQAVLTSFPIKCSFILTFKLDQILVKKWFDCALIDYCVFGVKWLTPRRAGVWGGWVCARGVPAAAYHTRTALGWSRQSVRLRQTRSPRCGFEVRVRARAHDGPRITFLPSFLPPPPPLPHLEEAGETRSARWHAPQEPRDGEVYALNPTQGLPHFEWMTPQTRGSSPRRKDRSLDW